MKKELLTGLTAATVALTAGARPCGPGFGGHHGFHGGPRFHGAPHHFHGGWGHAGRYGWPAVGAGLAGAWAARAYSDAVWAAQGFRPVYNYGYGYGYGYGVVAPTVVSSPVVYQQPVQQVVYQQPAQQVVYQQPAPQVVQQAPVMQQAPQPQEIKIVVEHQYPAQVPQETLQQQRVQ